MRSLLRSTEERRESGQFVIEGKKLFTETPRELISEVYLAARFEKEEAAFLAEMRLYPAEKYPGEREKSSVQKDGGLFYEVVEDGRFDTLCDTRTPQGILAVVKMRPEGKKRRLGRAASVDIHDADVITGFFRLPASASLPR